MVCLIMGCAGRKILGDIKCKMFLTNWRNGLENCNSLSVNSSSRWVYTNTTWETANHSSSHAGKDLEEANRKWLSTDLLLWKLMPLMLGAYTPYTNRSLISKWYKIILFPTFFTSPGVSADLMCQVLRILSRKMQAIKRGHKGKCWIRWKRFDLWEKKLKFGIVLSGEECLQGTKENMFFVNQKKYEKSRL